MENTTNTNNANTTEQVVIANKKNITNYLTPISIIIVGILIATALYLKDGNITKSNNKNLVSDALSGPAIEVKDIRDTDHIRGDKNAKIVIIEYSDTECPFCKVYHTTMKKIFDQYGSDKKVAWVYRHFPISYGENPLHKKAAKEAEATECAAELGGADMFWKYIDELYAITPSNDGLDLAKLPEIAVKVGLDKQKFQTCLDSGKYADKIKEEYEAAIKAGAKGTPYTVIKYEKEFIPLLNNNGEGLGALPYDVLRQIIEQLLNQKNG